MECDEQLNENIISLARLPNLITRGAFKILCHLAKSTEVVDCLTPSRSVRQLWEELEKKSDLNDASGNKPEGMCHAA